jgi:hypothetical protein
MARDNIEQLATSKWQPANGDKQNKCDAVFRPERQHPSHDLLIAICLFL